MCACVCLGGDVVAEGTRARPSPGQALDGQVCPPPRLSIVLLDLDCVVTGAGEG